MLANYRLLSPTLEISKLAGYICAERQLAGRPIGWIDAWIAASALGYGLPLVTHDGDFRGIEGLEIVSELDASRVRDCRACYGRGHLPQLFRQLAAGSSGDEAHLMGALPH